MSRQATYSVNYWTTEYPKQGITMQESSFAQFCLTQVEKGKNLLSICCGNGRDSVFFKNNGLNVWAFDIVPVDNTSFKFKELNLLDKPDCFGYDMQFDYVYCRFVLHAVTEDVEDYILSNARKVLKRQGKLFIEVRSDKGDLLNVVNHHYRRLINMDKLKQKLFDLCFRILHEEETNGLSVYNEDDPVLIRLVVDKMNIINREVGREMLLKMKEILDANNITFFLIFGTLLGAMREKDIIAHDSDVDIGLYYTDRDRVLQLVRRQVFARNGFQFKNKGFPTFYSFDYKGEYIDLFFFKKKESKYVCKCFHIDMKHFEGGLQDIEFLGTTFKTVRFPEDYLKDRYGENWRIPMKGVHAPF